ncbi:cell division protein FtsA [Rariglobus hedericola]|uniref:Cell division protein FtsA n=1 Tax=Rariglobus hedericola TaxID=2597822 RepID=A0A556QER6_9BACT|nr:cell division protein FtsA [Rariglobus hedericola]
MSRTKFIGAVEIGTSKVTVLIGELTQGRTLHIIGVGECQSRGVIKGAVADFKAASEATHSALMAAEQSAGTRIDEVYLAQTGGHLEGFYNEAAVNVSSADNLVSSPDIDTVCRLAKAKNLPEGRMVVHHLRRPFRLDGRNVPDPEHLVGQRLEAGYWTVHGQEGKIADNIHVIRGFNVRVAELILSSLASGTMLASAEDKQNGVLVIDVGAGTTDFVLYRDGCAQLTGVLPVGGVHLTNDLSLGLRVTEGQAEKLKLRFGRGTVVTKDRSEKVWLNGDFAIGDRQFPRHAIEQITAARTTELFEVVRKKLGAAFSPEKTAAGIILTGGTSKLPGIDEAAARVFGVQARLGEAPGWVAENLRDPGFSSVLGLLQYGLSSRADLAAPRAASRATGWVKKLFATA